MKFAHILPLQVFLLLLFLSDIAVNAQTDKNTITYKSPSKAFENITMQTFKGLPRFGAWKAIRFGEEALPSSRNAYVEMMNLKYGSSIYKDINLKNLTIIPRGTQPDAKQKHSQLAQRHLLKLASLVSTEETLKKYFCEDGDTPPCNFTQKNKNKVVLGYWGGTAARNNEFRQRRSYTSFVKDNFSQLKDWSTTFFKEDNEEGYMVYKCFLSYDIRGTHTSYDFSKKGYWLGTNITKPISNSLNAKLIPYTDNERSFVNSYKVLLPMLPKKAKELSPIKGEDFFLVIKVKVSHNKEYTSSSKIRSYYSYEFLEKTMQVYRDDALTNLIGELNMENLVTK